MAPSRRFPASTTKPKRMIGSPTSFRPGWKRSTRPAPAENTGHTLPSSFVWQRTHAFGAGRMELFGRHFPVSQWGQLCRIFRVEDPLKSGTRGCGGTRPAGKTGDSWFEQVGEP